METQLQKVEFQLKTMKRTYDILRRRIIDSSCSGRLDSIIEYVHAQFRVVHVIERLKQKQNSLTNKKGNNMKKLISCLVMFSLVGCGSSSGPGGSSLPIDTMVSNGNPAQIPAEQAPAASGEAPAAAPAEQAPAASVTAAPSLPPSSPLMLTADNCADAASKVAAGTSFLCNGVPSVGTLSVPVPCTFNGETSCIANGLYMAANLSNLSPSNIKSGVSVAGVNGSYAPADAHTDCSSNGQVGCVTTSAFKAADLSSLLANNIRSGVVVGGITGTLAPEAHATSGEIIAESHADCTANGQVGCVTTASYKSANLTNLVASNIKSGVSVAGVTGGYPSSTYPLSGSDAAVNDLDTATFAIKIKASSDFEWFDSSGNRYSRSGDTALANNALIKKDASIFGTVGTYSVAGLIAPEDYRYGVTLDGVGGKLLTSCQDTSSLTDVGGVVSCNAAKTLNVIDLTPGGCNPANTNNCMYKDAVTNLTWARNSETLPGKVWTYAQATVYCQAMVLNGVGSWRVPSKAEVLRAHSTFFQYASGYFIRGGSTWTTYSTSDVRDANLNVVAKNYLGVKVNSVISMIAEYEDGTRGAVSAPGVFCVK